MNDFLLMDGHPDSSCPSGHFAFGKTSDMLGTLSEMADQQLKRNQR
ncbi:MAG: hypothetical protein KAW52_04755 [candidate division Zixibacteria bacterium]|nr:hypothetical protein [candidate division Zixibacteria bacterium]